MPYDDLAALKAEMLYKGFSPSYDQNQEQMVYDDGASLLGQDPFMQPVGLFGKGKPKPVAPPIDIQRRAIFGLKPQAPLPDNLPAVRSSDVPVPSAVPQPQVSQPQASEPVPPIAAPLAQLANQALNASVTRREVLKKAGQGALNQALPIPKVADVAPPLVQLSKAPLTPAYDKSAIVSAVSSFVTDKMKYALKDLAEELGQLGIRDADEPYDTNTTTAWEYARYGDEETPNGLKTLRDNFNLKKLSEYSGIPVQEIQKYLTDSDLQRLPLEIGNSQNAFTSIIEDGRPKEYVSNSAISDLNTQTYYLKKSAEELYGKRKDFKQLELESIAKLANELAYEDFVRRTFSFQFQNQAKQNISSDVMQQAGNNWLSTQLKEIFQKGSEAAGYDSDSLLNEAYEIFKLKE